jgi:hypothetical protein
MASRFRLMPENDRLTQDRKLANGAVRFAHGDPEKRQGVESVDFGCWKILLSSDL